MYNVEELEQKARRALDKKATFGDDVDLDSFDSSFVPHKYLAEEEMCAIPREEQNRLIMSGLDVTGTGRGGTYFQKDTSVVHCHSNEELFKPRVLFAYEMNDRPLPPEYGGPLRLLMPSKYGYKSVKTIVRLEFLDKGGTGYWSNYGYSKDATIEPGTDHALDLKEYKRITKQGEPEY